MKRRIAVAFTFAIPLAIFFAAREMAALRPERMTANSPQTYLVESLIAKQSRSNRWTAMMMEDGKTFLWDKERQKMRSDIGAGLPIFSDDDKWFAVIRPLVLDGPFADYPRPSPNVEGSVENLATGQRIFLQPAKGVHGIQDCAFNTDNSILIAVAAKNILRWNTTNGRLISNTKSDFNALDGVSLQLFSGGTQVWASQWAMNNMNDKRQTLVFATASGKKKRAYPYQSTLLPDERFLLRFDSSVTSGLFIHRVTDGKQVFHKLPEPNIIGAPEPLFSDEGKWLLIYRESAAKLIEVGTWREIAQCQMPMPYSWRFDDKDHVLAQDDKGRVTRWRLR